MPLDPRVLWAVEGRGDVMDPRQGGWRVILGEDGVLVRVHQYCL